MAKHSRVLKFVGGYHTYKPADGTVYEEEVEDSGLFEARHDHADHAVEMGVATEYAGDMAEAKEKFKAEKAAAAQPVKKI